MSLLLIQFFQLLLHQMFFWHLLYLTTEGQTPFRTHKIHGKLKLHYRETKRINQDDNYLSGSKDFWIVRMANFSAVNSIIVRLRQAYYQGDYYFIKKHRLWDGL